MTPIEHLTDEAALIVIDDALSIREQFADYVAQHYSPKLAETIREYDFRAFVQNEFKYAFDLWEIAQL